MSRFLLVVRPVVLAVAFVTVVTGAEEASQVFQPKDVAQLKSVLAAEMSPDGKWVAYVRSVPRTPLADSDGRAWSELHVIDAANQSRPYVAGEVNVSAIRWTPDGRAITYLANRNDDKNMSLYLIPIDGGESRKLVSHATAIQSYAISTDGRRVAFLATQDKTADQQTRSEKGFDQEIYEEDLAATRVWLVDVDTRGNAEEPTVAVAKMLDLHGSASYVEWSPSGRELAVVLAKTPTVDDSYMFRRVHLVDSDSGRIVQSFENPGKLGQVGFSPDGNYLGMISAADLNDPHEGRLMIAKTSGETALVDVMPNYQAHVSAFVWRDASTLLWLADEGELTRLGTATVQGQSERMPEPLNVIATSLSLSQGGQTAVAVANSPSYPPEVVRIELSNGTTTQATHCNPTLGAFRLATQEVIRWQARDGVQLGGVLMKPLNYVPGRRYPLIMVVHGGPESHVPHGWTTSYSSPGQMAAARGFAVFYPNYRGSTGRGVAFSKMGQADAAGKEFDDLVDGVDYLVDIGLVDKGRVGITGGSYGGYASAWGATYYSDRFAASVMFVGISDNISKVGTTDIPEEMYLVHHRKRLWEDWSYFAERSPIHYVQRNHTPTLILHGKQDPRVHPSQSLELFRHLKTLGQAPVRLVLYEGEGHGNRKAAARFDYSLRLLQWMEHYLQGPGGEAPPYDLDYDAALK